MEQEPGRTVLLTIKLLDHRYGRGGDLQIAELPCYIFQTSYPYKGREWRVRAQDLLANIQNSPSRIDCPAKVYYSQAHHRQCLLRLEDDGSSIESEGSLPLENNWTVWLDIEDIEEWSLPSSRSSSSGPDSPAHRDDAYLKAASLLRNIPSDCLPGIPRWTPEELAEHDLQLSLLSEEELAQLESYRFQESRKQSWIEAPTIQHGVENVTPARSPRPWEHRPTDDGIPGWLQHRQLKKKRRTGQWDPTVKPVYPTFVFTAARWNIPDNTRYTRKEVNDAVVNYLKTLLVERHGYWEFVESKGRSLPLLDLLRQNHFAKCMLHELTKIRCPPILPICGGSIVTKENVLVALDRRPSWGSDCMETLDLVELYGPGGPREQPVVTAAIYADVEHQMGSVQFLKLLRTTDEQWRTPHES